MNRNHDHTPRLKHWDYATGWAYFVTFKVAERRPVLGSVSDGEVSLSAAGTVVESCWRALPDEYPIVLDVHIIMPDHVHAILLLEGASGQATAPQRGFRPLMTDPRITLGKVVRGWKARSTIRIRRECDPMFEWQSRYFDRVIRNREELDRIRAYVLHNPVRWTAKARTG
jgi:putative transposase